ncbi:vanadium-dependent haloperoxidase [Adhaeretor mobilis]|uniref:PAP2 superfamily protein n=1 Tax=Adhaeretor mobilis TaxID=1930276 RepID=A0A517MZL3_9BACT|nr:vanadium-dependent haloperoxidase [Adhaeretor mobilis]QDT00326.1 PAP2 superfamily protein [Adhaeretor mobilis]
MKPVKKRSVEKLETRNLLAADVGLGDDLLASTVEETETVQVSSFVVSATTAESTELLQTSDGQLAVESDVVLEWNELFGDLLVADEANQNPGYASRSMAMLNLAIYDAVSIASGDLDNTFYDYATDIVQGLSNISTEVAASQAAYTVLSSLYTDQQPVIDTFLGNILGNFGQNSDTAGSVALGTEVGEQVLAERANDGSDVLGDYTYTDEVGFFQADPLNPDVPAWGPTWGEVDTFAISSVESFVPETTPALTSEDYAESYNEVLELGAVDSTTRTADQTEAGIFWAYDREGLGTPLALFSDVLETIATQEGNTLEENAALYAQASVAMADAAIVAWQTKFGEEFWRPVTAIHDGDLDGNSLTEGDEDWVALGAPDGGEDIIGFTPQFPTYISGHATFGGALFGTLQEFYGTDDISFELTSSELEILLEDPELQEAYGLDLDDATRQFDSLSEAMAENGRSRVYLGIHFDFDDLVGQEVGQAVAADVASQFVVASDDGVEGVEESVLRYEITGRNVTSDLIVAVDDSQVEIVDARSGEVLETRSTEETSQVQIVATDRGNTHVTVDLNTEDAVLPGGIVIEGGDGRRDVVDLFGTDGADSVLVDGNTVIVNGTTIEYSGIDSIRWHGGPEDSLTTIADGDAQFFVTDGDRGAPPQTPDGQRDGKTPDRDGRRLAGRGQPAQSSRRDDARFVDEVFSELGALEVLSPLDRQLLAGRNQRDGQSGGR